MLRKQVYKFKGLSVFPNNHSLFLKEWKTLTQLHKRPLAAKHIWLFDCVLLCVLWITPSAKDIPQLIFTLLLVVLWGHKWINLKEALCPQLYLNALRLLAPFSDNRDQLSVCFATGKTCKWIDQILVSHWFQGFIDQKSALNTESNSGWHFTFPLFITSNVL